ncbi:hypothetical protein D1871_06005 [Nakamurella silvestris]|nr:hypothetical protein D1871_06005 [Nakamurella silvestris]
MATAAPPGLIDRPRLVELAHRTVTLITGPSGYGKSTLIRQLAVGEATPAVYIELHRPVSVAALISTLELAARKDGLSDLAGVLVGDPPEVLGKLLAQLTTSGGLTLAVDEIDLLDDTAAGWLAELCAAVESPTRILLAGRAAPAELAALTGSGSITAEQLTFTRAETEQILAGALPGLPVQDPVQLVLELTGGWPAAVAVAAARRAAAHGGQEPGDTTIIGLPEVSTLDGAIRALVSLPLLDQAVAELVAGPPGLQVLADLAIPTADRGDGWWEIPEPVRDRLGDPAGLDLELRRRIAGVYAVRAALPTGVSLLAAAADPEGVARLLGSVSWRSLQSLGHTELDVRIRALPEEVLRRHPEVLTAALRTTEWAGVTPSRTDWLDRAARLTAPTDTARPAVDTELARQFVRRGHPDEAIELVDRVLADPSTDARTRGRALVVKAQAVTSGDRASQLIEGRQLFERAAVQFRDVGERRWEAETWAGLGYSIDFSIGAIGAAVEHLTRAVNLLGTADTQRAQTLTLLAEALVWLPDYERAATAAAEAEQIAARTYDDRTIAFGQWCWAWVTSRQGDAAATTTRIAAAMQRRGVWSEHAVGVTMHAEFAALLADIGDETGAFHQLELGHELGRSLGYESPLRRAEAIVHAKVGDPAVGAKLLRALVEDPDTTPLYRWQYLLLAAWCAHRRVFAGVEQTDGSGVATAAPGEAAGNGTEAAELARLAFESAQALGHPAVVEALEPEIGRWARALVGGRQTREPVRIRLFGAIQVRRGTADVPLPPGQAAELVAMLAAGGPLGVEEVIDRLWPEADRSLGRARLRNLLNRLRAHSGELVLREGQRLVLVPGAEVDVDRFTVAAEEARSAEPENRPGLARQALANLDWPLLAEIEQPWLVPIRNGVRRRALALFDLVADDAFRAGDLDDAARMLERAIELEPYDEVRYVRLTEVFRRQGRRGSARAVLRRAMAMTAEMGITPSPPLAALVRALGRAPR